MLALCLFSTAATLWRQAELPSTPVPSSLASMAERAANSLRSAEQRACCFESTTGGLIQASLLALPGASKFTTCGAVAYTSSRGVGVLGPSDARPLGEPLDTEGHRSRPQDAAAYVASKQERAQALARRKRLECGAEWCVSENGACGPTFAYEGLEAGFTAIFVSGPVRAARSDCPAPQPGAYSATLPFKQPACLAQGRPRDLREARLGCRKRGCAAAVLRG